MMPKICYLLQLIYMIKQMKKNFILIQVVQIQILKKIVKYILEVFKYTFWLQKYLPYEYRNVIRTKVIPRLYKFKPDIIFISAGFDGHENESINQYHMSLNDFDFAFITQQIQFVANKFAKGRVVSVLQGGYNV